MAIAPTAPAEAAPAAVQCARVRSAARGDAAAFEKLYQRYSRSVYNLVLRSVRSPQEAEDLCQEIWVRAHRDLIKLRDPVAFPLWLYRVAGRACVDAARKRSRASLAVGLPDTLAALPNVNPEDTAIHREHARLAWEALGVLPPRQHLALFLKEVEGHSYRQIAEILETSESAVETLLFRARRGFAKAYERLETATRERCRQARRVMAVLVDGEATAVGQRALSAHIDGCQPCRAQVDGMRRASVAYSGLVLAPVPALLGERIFEATGVATALGRGAGSVAKLIALTAAKTKLVAILTVAGGIAVSGLVAPTAAPSTTSGGTPESTSPTLTASTTSITPSEGAIAEDSSTADGQFDSPSAAPSSLRLALEELVTNVGGLPSAGPILEEVMANVETLSGPIQAVAAEVTESAQIILLTSAAAADSANVLPEPPPATGSDGQ